MKEKLRVVWMALLVAALLVMAGGFWTFVDTQAKKEKALEEASVAEEIREDKGGIRAMYIAIGTTGDSSVFVDEGGNLFTVEIPEDALYNENGKKIPLDQFFSGDMVKFYGEITVQETYPAVYTGVERMVRISKGSIDDAKKYSAEIQESFGKPIYARERTQDSLLDEQK